MLDSTIIPSQCRRLEAIYVYYYIHPFGQLGRPNGIVALADIPSATEKVDYFLHDDMEKLLTIYDNLASLTHPDSGLPVTSWAEYDLLCGGRDCAQDYYYRRFPPSDSNNNPVCVVVSVISTAQCFL